MRIFLYDSVNPTHDKADVDASKVRHLGLMGSLVVVLKSWLRRRNWRSTLSRLSGLEGLPRCPRQIRMMVVITKTIEGSEKNEVCRLEVQL